MNENNPNVETNIDNATSAQSGPSDKQERVIATLPLENEEGKKLSRAFLGTLMGTNTKDVKELQAYLKGRVTFTYKKKDYPVRQKYFYI